ncbi:MAG: ribonuclease P protein component [Candidatus Caenarcaniphilales bacterium]|nr:ribonuclease P protein component [Candidatus Caenarcaniphilales bacterium]
MLKREERLKYNGLFLQAFEKGRTLKSDNFRITYTKTRGDYSDKLPYVGFVVSKKFSKKAVIRNKYKRAMREIYRLFRMDSKKAESLKKIGLLVIAIKNHVTASKDISVFNKYQEELKTALDKVILQTNSK